MMPAVRETEDFYTYADYLKWPDDVRYELLEGVPYLMAAPTEAHQGISFELGRQLGNFLLDKPCRAYQAPFDVRLFADEGDAPEDVDTVVQPDISVFCHPERLDGKGGRGAPDFIIEILSPSTRENDLHRKFNLYLKAGVREYWIVDPEAKTVHAFVLDGEKYVSKAFHIGGGGLPVTVLEGCTVDLDRVFGETGT